MILDYGKISIRDVSLEDAKQLWKWWNDGRIMAHAGFPNGINITLESVVNQITNPNKHEFRHLILYNQRSIGEMVYRKLTVKTCQIGIKICDFSMQNKGIGKIVLSLFINALFEKYQYEKIILDTDLNNKRAQHVYEQLGFKKISTNNTWIDQVGNIRIIVDYELKRNKFISYL